MADARPSNRWIDEQAAEYADLVGSFVESVHDEETDEMIEYQLIWEGGDLGVALTPLENEPMGVMVSRVTGKGFPFGIKNVGSGDILLSINLRDTTKMTLDQVVAFLQECDLPATLRFKKVSPDTDRPSAPPAVPRVSHFVVTSDVPTSPVGSSRPPASSSAASNRMSQKAVAAGATYAQQQQQSRTTRGESAASNRTSAQYGRSSSGRPSDAAAVPPPAATRQTSGNAANAPPAPVAAPAAHEEAAAAQMMARMTVDSYGSATEERESWKSSEGDIDEARERMAAHQSEEKEEEDDEPIAMPMPVPTLARGESNEEEQPQRKHAQSVAMLGDFSIETNGIPILPEESIGMIVSVDGVPQADADDDVSPIGHAVQPTAASRISHVPGTMPPIDDKPDMPRESVRLTMDGAAEPMMKSQPIGALHELCAKGNLRSVMQHIKVNGPDPLIQREANHGQTCLHLAVKSGNVQLVKHILEQYEPVDELINVEDDKGNTALHFAATKTPGMVHMLLETGASANVKNSRKLTPLIISVITSRDDNVIIPRMLLKYGANPNDMHDSQTVIHTAVGSGLLHIAGALVRAGAKMDVEDTEGKSIYEKLDKKSLRFLISHIYFPPTHITEKERTDCMLCHKKIKFGHRKNNCTHCGRLCCSECCSLAVEMYKFPMGFPGRVRKGAAVRDLKKVCKTCYGVFKERGDTPQKEESRFFNRVIGIEWDEVNPNKMDSYRAAGRRGEKDY